MEASAGEVIEHVAGGPVTVPQPQYDPYFSGNEKVIQDLLVDERRYHSTPAYCIHQPEGMAKWMRRTLLNWLRDVCVHRQTDAGVLAQTAQLIDRYLHVSPIDKREYQLVGSTCFFITSKLKETVPVSLACMAKYTDYSVDQEDIVAKELTICLSLKWDLSCITPVDFIAPIVDFLEFVPSLRQIIRQAALNIYIKAFHVEDLGMYLPSYVAAACILYALNLTVHPDLSEVALRSVTRIQQLLKLEARKIREVYQQLQSCFEPGTIQLSEAVIKADSNPPPSPPQPTEVKPRFPVSQFNHVGSATTSTSLAPLATSTRLQPRRHSNSSCTHSNSLSSMGSTSSGSSFERVAQHLLTHSYSFSTSPDYPHPHDIENDQPPLNSIPRSLLPPSCYMTSTSHPSQCNYVTASEHLHPNVHAAGQTLADPFLMASSSWQSKVVNLMNKTADLMSLNTTTMFPHDPRFLLLAASELHHQESIQRHWISQDTRELRLDPF